MARIFFLTLCLYTLGYTVYAQHKSLGIEYANGKTVIDEGQLTLINPLNYPLSKYHKIGFSYHYKLINKSIDFTPGLNYEYTNHELWTLNYVKLPICIDFVTPGKIHFIMSGGFYAGFLVAYENKLKNDSKKEVNRWNLGFTAKSGLGIKLSDVYTASFTCQYNFDATHFYTEENITAEGVYKSTYFLSNQGVFNVGIIYQLKYQ